MVLNPGGIGSGRAHDLQGREFQDAESICNSGSLHLCVVADPVEASPITYSFGGTLDEPVNGTTSFTGTFSYELNAPGFETGQTTSGWGGAFGTLSIGDQTAVFQNGPANFPTTIRATFSIAAAGNDSFWFYGTNGTSAQGSVLQGAVMTIQMIGPLGGFPDLIGSLPTLNLSEFTFTQLSLSLTTEGPEFYGSITSLQALPQFSSVPEVTTVVHFAVLALGLAVYHRRGRIQLGTTDGAD